VSPGLCAGLVLLAASGAVLEGQARAVSAHIWAAPRNLRVRD